MSKITQYRIVIPQQAQTNEFRAAAFVRENVKLVCGKKLEIVRDTEPATELEIVVGKTNRETLDGLSFHRSRDGIWEYKMVKKGGRLYLTGLGIPPQEVLPYTSAYRKMDDGAVGTVMAAYHFVEDILGYQFVYASYDAFPEDPELEMPEAYEFSFTREAMRLQRPKTFDGAAFYSLNAVEEIHWNVGSFIFKTREGRLIVMDGGHKAELPRLVECLKTISGQEVPTVSAWIFSHLHSDHYGSYLRLSLEAEWRDKLRVEDVYFNFLTRDYFTNLAPDGNAGLGEAFDGMMASGEALNANIHIVQKGDLITVDEIEFEVLHVPDPALASQMRVNDSSVVYKMTYDKGQTILFLGDAERFCDNDLVENCAHKLKSDVVQVGHHGCGSVSAQCYGLIDAKVYIWQCGERFWYQESCEGLNTHNVGLIRYRAIMKEAGVKNENVYATIHDIHSFPLPMPIY